MVHSSGSDLRMLELDSSDAGELSLALLVAVRRAKLTLAEMCARLEADYGVRLTPSVLSHTIGRGSIRFRRALQILAVCGTKDFGIKSASAT